MELKGLKINFLGDSITQGCGVTPETVFHAVAAKEAGFTAINHGAGGSCFAREISEEEAEGWPQCFCDRIDDLDADADMVVVFGGVNDYGHGSAPIGTPNDRTPDTFYGACHYMIQTLLDKFPGKPIVFMTPVHYQAEMLKNMHGKIFKEYVKIIRDVCEEYSIPICDIYANSGIIPALESQRPIFIPDGVHPNARGHEIIASRFLGFMRSL